MSMAVTGIGAGSGIMPMTGASSRMPPQQKMSNLFNAIDGSGSGSITQAQFSQAFQTMNPPAAIAAQGANAVWSQLDPNGAGSVSKAGFISGMKNVMAAVHKGGHHQHGDGGPSPSTSTNTLTSAGQTLDGLGSGSGTTTNGGINILA